MSKELAFQDVKNSFAADAGPPSASAVDEISQEISVCSLMLTPFKIQFVLYYVTCFISLYNFICVVECFIEYSRGNTREGDHSGKAPIQHE